MIEYLKATLEDSSSINLYKPISMILDNILISASINGDNAETAIPKIISMIQHMFSKLFVMIKDTNLLQLSSEQQLNW